MRMAPLATFAGRIAAELASKPGKFKNNTNIIVLPKWYWIVQLIFSLLLCSVFLLPLFFDKEFTSDKENFNFLIITLLIFITSMMFLFLHLFLYKIVIEFDHIKIRKLFIYRTYEYSNIYIHFSSSYDFLYYKGKYLTRLAYQLNNLGTLYETYLEYFKTNDMIPPASPFASIKQSRIWLLLTLCIQILIICIFMILYFDTGTLFWWLIIFEIPVILLTLYTYVWRIKYDKNTLTFRNIFGITKIYNVKEVKYKIVNNGYKLLHNEKYICFIWNAQNTLSLFSMIKDIDSKIK